MHFTFQDSLNFLSKDTALQVLGNIHPICVRINEKDVHAEFFVLLNLVKQLHCAICKRTCVALAACATWARSQALPPMSSVCRSVCQFTNTHIGTACVWMHMHVQILRAVTMGLGWAELTPPYSADPKYGGEGNYQTVMACDPLWSIYNKRMDIFLTTGTTYCSGHHFKNDV